MRLVYRCESCGLSAQVVAGAIGLSGDQIHCPRCGRRAARHQETPHGGNEVIQVELAADGETTREIPGLRSPDTFDEPTRRVAQEVRSELVAELFDETEQEASGPRLGRVSSGAGQPSVPSRSRRATDDTPVGPPPMAFSAPTRRLRDSPGTEKGAGTVTRIETIDVGSPKTAEPMHPPEAGGSHRPAGEGVVAETPVGPMYTGPGQARPRAPEPSGPPMPGPGSPLEREVVLGQAAADLAVASYGRRKGPDDWPPAPHVQEPRTPVLPPTGHQAPVSPPSAEDAARPDDVPGRAWSASVIRRALSKSGSDWGDSPTLIPGEVTADMVALPEVPQVRVEVPESRTPPVPAYLGAAKPGVLDSDVEQPVIAPAPAGAGGFSDSHQPPHRRSDQGAAPAVEPVGHATPRSTRPSQRAPGSKVLLAVLICVAVVAVGVLLGVVWYERDQGPEGAGGSRFVAATLDAAALERAERRAEAFGLDPLDQQTPFAVGYELAAFDYPSRLQLRVRLENQSTRDISRLRLSSAWYLVHDGPVVVSQDGAGLDREVSVSQPLESGDAVVASMEFVTDDLPTGAARESFAWVELTAADDALNIFYSGAVLMVDLPVSGE